MNLNQIKRTIATKTNAHYEERHFRFTHNSMLADHYVDNPLYSPEHEGHHHTKASVFFDDDTYYTITWCAEVDAYHWEKWMNQVDRMVIAAPEDESEMLDHLRAVTTYGNAIWDGASTPFQHVSVSTVSHNTKTKRYEPVPVSAHTSQYDVKV